MSARDTLQNLHVLSGSAYMKLRRSLSKVPFLYRLYRMHPALQSLDGRLATFSGTTALATGAASRGDDAAIQDAMRQVKLLLDAERYPEALDAAKALFKKRETITSSLALGLMTACEKTGAWQWCEEVYLPVLTSIAQYTARKGSQPVREQCCAVLEECALALLRNARLDLALEVLSFAESVNPQPRYGLLRSLIRFIRQQEQEATRRGTHIRSGREDEINLVGSVVWGEAYLDTFMRFNVRSMLASGNMPHLAGQGLLVHSIVTTPEGREFIERHPLFPELARTARVEFFCFPASLTGLFAGSDKPDMWSYLLYGVLDHVNIFLARALKANLFLIPVDSVVASPTFTNLRRYLEEGYDCCGGASIVAEREGFLPSVEGAFGTQGALEADTYTLASIAVRTPHPYVAAQFVHDGNRNFGKHPRKIFWPAEGGMIAHSIYTHPYATSARRITGDFVLPYSWVDFLLAPRLFSDPADFPKYKIIENAAEAYVANFAPAARSFEGTGRAFDPQEFVATHYKSFPIHRYMFTVQQFIPCNAPAFVCHHNPDADVARVMEAFDAFFNKKAPVPQQAQPVQEPAAEAPAAPLPSAQPVPESLPQPEEKCCHLCEGTDLTEVIDMGMMPLSHQLRTSLEEEEQTYPLRFHYCNGCGLLQIRDSIPPESLYEGDAYATGFQRPRHIEDLIITALAHLDPGPALEIGCNDGYLLKALSHYDFPLLAGVEPNPHAAAVAARNTGYHIYGDYLSPELTDTLRKKHPPFDFIFMRHVIEHVSDLKGFFESVSGLLSEKGLLIAELPHVEVGFAAGSPVVLWEEHVNYFTEELLFAMFAHFGWEIVDKRVYAFGGGSIALVARRAEPRPLDKTASLAFPLSYCQRYAEAIWDLNTELQAALEDARSRGYSVLLYGAGPRSSTLINFAQVADKVDWVVDDREDIENRLMPGTDKPILQLKHCELDERPVMALLGVGAEHEHRILGALSRRLGYTPIAVSLFPPRDIRESLQKARVMMDEDAQTERRTA